MTAPACHGNIWEAEAGSRPVWAAEWDPIWKHRDQGLYLGVRAYRECMSYTEPSLKPQNKF